MTIEQIFRQIQKKYPQMKTLSFTVLPRDEETAKLMDEIEHKFCSEA